MNMAENQIQSYINIAQKNPPKEITSEQHVLDVLKSFANPQVKPGEQITIYSDLKEGDRGYVIEFKRQEQEQKRIEDETRAMFGELKRERVTQQDGTELAFVDTPHADVLRFLPPFLMKIAKAEQPSDVLNRTSPEMARNVIDAFMKYVVDQGIAREQKFGDEKARGVDILNRAAFSTFVLRERNRRRQQIMEQKIINKEKYTQESLDDEVDAQFTFRQIDIKDFRASDFARDKDGNSGADFTINKVAAHLNKMVGRINRVFQSHNIDAMVVPCRYGGDELGLSFMGIEDSSLRNIIYSAITGLNETDDPETSFQNGIKMIEGYFNRGGVIMSEKVDLKAGLEELTVPKDKAKKKIFWEQFDIGLILNDEEIQDIQVARQNEPGVSLAIGKQEAPSFETKEEFAAYAEKLTKRHPELAAIAKTMVNYVDDMPEVMTEFPKFVQEILYDRLLGEKVTGFQDCVDHMVRGDMKELYMFDMKGIKEFNDVQSLAVGDQAIATLWNHIANSLGADFENVMCFRRGSTFIVGIRKDAEIQAETRAKLDGLTSISFQGNTFDIGFNHKSVEGQRFAQRQSEAAEGEEDVRVTIEDLIVNTHEAWNRTIIDKYLIPNPGLLSMDGVKKGTRFSPEQGLTLFFNGKRAIERYERGLEVCAGMIVDAQAEAQAGKSMGTDVEQYQKLHETMVNTLFTSVFPTKLEEARKADDKNKTQEIVSNWKRLLAKYGHSQDLSRYGIT